MAETDISDTYIDPQKELSALHSLQSNMQLLCQKSDDEDALIQVAASYYFLLSNEEKRKKVDDAIISFITKRLTPEEFKYKSYRTSTEKENKELKKDINKAADKMKNNKTLRSHIFKEIEFRSKEKQEYRGIAENDILSVAIIKTETGQERLQVAIDGRKEPLYLACYLRGPKHFSHIGFASMGNKTKNTGFNDSDYELVKSCKEQGFVFEDVEKPAEAGKRYSPSEFKKILGLKSTDSVTTKHTEWLAELNTLSKSDQERFVNDLNKRRVLLKKYREIIDYVAGAENKISLVTSPDILRELLKKHKIPDFCTDMQKSLICMIKKDTSIWNKFTKTPEKDTNGDNNKNNSRFSRYEVLLSNFISGKKAIFEKALNFEPENKKQVQQALKMCFSDIRNATEHSFGDELCTEIVALGIFKAATNAKTSADKLKNMNLLLNELGINIDFKELPVVSAPSEEIETAQQQKQIDRDNFEQLKRSKEFIAEDQNFKTFLKEQGIDNPAASSTHHYIALKYNPFVAQELNDNSLLIRTARAHAWNYDGHLTTHLFDTAGEFLIKDIDEKYALADFNNLRTRHNSGEAITILAPVLQIKDASGKAFRDLLALNPDGKCGYYASDDNTKSIFNIPQYCKSGISNSLLSYHLLR
ncbi:MAG: hypothetical protein IKO06_03025 [Alphaproteobacteria bacterium]|nr:hypothetical protein [Alphaproteobacteria bacterium]